MNKPIKFVFDEKSLEIDENNNLIFRRKMTDSERDLFLSEIFDIPYNEVPNTKFGVCKAEDVKSCENCKNNVEYPPPHTCDECTSLAADEDYSMWEYAEKGIES